MTGLDLLSLVRSHLFLSAADSTSTLAVWVPATAVMTAALVAAVFNLIGKRGETRVSEIGLLIADQLNYIAQVNTDNARLREAIAAQEARHAAEIAQVRETAAAETRLLRQELLQVRQEADRLRDRVGNVEKDVDGFS